ncbi:AP2/ERF domain-containing protein PFD0985w-like [Physella acuta]|uniref:AP2/ERF domain-containing protein PFD0985w-like n=1 Tax=Physella acuta TaxID=109671 RepID=UPI0027DE654B|nr:AP2/ERF domain-containing protein PFD0985w-like [Physella acuta]
MDAKSTEKKPQKTKAPPHKKTGKNNSKKKSQTRPDSSGNRSDSSRHMTSPADDLEPHRLEDQTNKDENNDDNRDETYEDNSDSVHNENNDDKKEASDNDHDDTGDDEKNNNDDDDEIFFDDPILSREFETRSGAPYNGYYGADAANPGLSTRQAKIIKDILANFDLEKVMDRYRGETVYRSLNKRNRRVWLEGMMGNEKVPFNDRKWNESVQAESHERSRETTGREGEEAGRRRDTEDSQAEAAGCHQGRGADGQGVQPQQTERVRKKI